MAAGGTGLIGRHKGKNLVYAGNIDHGFDKVSAAEQRKRLELLVRKNTQSLAKRIVHKGLLGRGEASSRDRVPCEVCGASISRR
jgi:hypothetical protein